MEDSECVQFLRWALPRLHMQWSGYRKVRSQVCKRISRRLNQLNIDNIAAYQACLEQHPQEWDVLDALSRVTISRFYRDKAMFVFLESEVLPALAQQALNRHSDHLRVWCIGSSSGEEPYTIALIWRLQLQSQFPHLRLEIIATEIESNMNQRAKVACYQFSSIKNLPADWRKQVFNQEDDVFCLKPEYCRDVHFIEQDIREELPPASFDLALCRNLVFTYFDEVLQGKILDHMRDLILPNGALVIGIHEDLPENAEGLGVWSDRLRIFRKDIEAK